MLSRHHAFSSGAATVAIAALLAFAPAAFAAEPEVEALQEEIDALRAKVALLEQHVIKIEEHVGVTPAMLQAPEAKGDTEGAIELLTGEGLGNKTFFGLQTRPERQPFGKL